LTDDELIRSLDDWVASKKLRLLNTDSNV